MRSKIDTLQIAYAGGAFPGGMFGAGVNKALTGKVSISEVIGISSGAVNASILTMGQADHGQDIWRGVLEPMPKVFDLNPKEVIKNHSFFTVRDPVYAAIDTYFSLEAFKNSGIRARIVYLLLKQCPCFSINTTKALVSEGENWAHILMSIKFFRDKSLKQLKFLDSKDMDNATEEEAKKILKASCSMPPFYGRALKSSDGLMLDAALVDSFGGIRYLLKDALRMRQSEESNSIIAAVTRYPHGSSTLEQRKKQLGKIGQDIALIAPSQSLPISSHYSNNMEELNTCFDLGVQAGEAFLRQYT